MPLASRADLEALIGPVRVTELLREAVNIAADAETREAQELQRLAAALRWADALIGTYITIPASPPEELVTLAADEALYVLNKSTPAGASPSQHDDAVMRRKTLAAMRKNDRWTGGPESVAPRRSRVVKARNRNPWNSSVY